MKAWELKQLLELVVDDETEIYVRKAKEPGQIERGQAVLATGWSGGKDSKPVLLFESVRP